MRLLIYKEECVREREDKHHHAICNACLWVFSSFPTIIQKHLQDILGRKIKGTCLRNLWDVHSLGFLDCKQNLYIFVLKQTILHCFKSINFIIVQIIPKDKSPKNECIKMSIFSQHFLWWVFIFIPCLKETLLVWVKMTGILWLVGSNLSKVQDFILCIFKGFLFDLLNC